MARVLDREQENMNLKLRTGSSRSILSLAAILGMTLNVASSSAQADGFPYQITDEQSEDSAAFRPSRSTEARHTETRAQLAYSDAPTSASYEHTNSANSVTQISPSSVGSSTGPDATGERREAARAHYERSRTMLLESLAEFEAARGIARPDRIMNAEQFRANVLSRVGELDRVIDPQPRVVESAVATKAQPTLLREEASGGKSAGVHSRLPTALTTPLIIEKKTSESSKTKVISKSSVAPKSHSAGKISKSPVTKIEKKSEISAREERLKTAKLAEDSINGDMLDSDSESLDEQKPAAREVVRHETTATKTVQSGNIQTKTETKQVTQTAKSEEAVKDDVLDDLVSESEKSVAEAPKADSVASSKAADRRLDPLTEDELKVRLKKLAADIEARDASSDAATGNSQLAVEPTAKD